MGYQLSLGWEEKLQGFKYIEGIQELLRVLRPVGTERDRAHNRQFFFDQYVSLLLLYFFNPIVDSLRGLQKATALKKVQKQCGGQPVSLAALSEAAAAFKPEALRKVFRELAGKAFPVILPRDREALRTLTAVDGSLLPALSRMVWALWKDATHRAVKLHLHFEVARGIPVDASLTAGQDSEVGQLRTHLEAGRLYVLDRGYAAYALLEAIINAKASFIVRVKANIAYVLQQEREITLQAQAAGVLRDVLVSRLGSDHRPQLVTHPVRLLEIKSGYGTILLVTDQLTMDADLIALAYRYRWTVELFFRWLKCVLGCRHWLGHSFHAVQIQVYAALIASLLLVIWTGRKPNKRTFEMFCLYFAGWATAEELHDHLEKLPTG
ncbi:MAG: IS4 family transposase [Herminiimonas sp.]|nr:IS4 family transposase [Herminiimonas sp.]